MSQTAAAAPPPPPTPPPTPPTPAPGGGMLAAVNAVLIEQQSKQALDSEGQKKIITDEYQERVKLYAQYDGFRISIQDKKTGNWPPVSKLFRYHKITVQDYAKAKEMAQGDAVWKQNAEPPLSLEESVLLTEETLKPESIVELADRTVQRHLDYHRFLASCYLHMSSEDFDRCDWSKLRLVIEACNYRTERSLASFSEGLFMFFMIENARGEPYAERLTHRDIEMLNMYQLWVGPAKLKPWDLNGGIIYEEDISTFLKIEEYKIIGEKKKEKQKQHRRESSGGGGISSSGSTIGADGVLHKRATRVRGR